MHEYAFVSIALTHNRDGHRLERDYRDVIREHAKRGFTFVQAIPLTTLADPHIDLVFSRKVKK